MNLTHTAPEAPTLHRGSTGLAANPPTSLQRHPEWFLYSADEVLGPFTMSDMTRFAAEGRLWSDLSVTRRDVPDWMPASADALLAPLFETGDGDHRPEVATDILSTRPKAPRVTVWPAAPAPLLPRVSTATDALEMEQDMAPPNPCAVGMEPQGMPPAPFAPQIPNRYTAAFPGAVLDAIPATSREPRCNALTGTDARLADRDGRVLPAGGVALMSFILPGAGQLANGQVARAGVFLLLILVAWPIGLGWVLHLWAAVDAWRGSLRRRLGGG